MSSETIGLITVPIFTGVIGYTTNWTGVWMLFYPVHFAGFRLPGLRRLAHVLPRRIQQVPGVMVGGIGWQGIIPSRAAKMGSIAVDKGIAKVGSARDFYRQLDPQGLADHIVRSSRGDIRALVDRIMRREHPRLWMDLPPRLREALHERVQEQYPEVVDDIVVHRIAENMDDLLDVKLMVIRRMEEQPELANKVFRSVGEKELQFIIRFGFYFGFALGVPTAVVLWLAHSPLLLIPFGIMIGWVTNWLAILMIFEPVEPRRYGPFRFQGLFLRRQQEVADVYADVISNDIITVGNIGEELLHGPRSDRTRSMIAAALRPSVDRAVGRVRPAVRVAIGSREYDAIRDSVAVEAVDHTMTPLTDPEFNREQREKIHELFADRMREMDSNDFSEMLRSAIKQDEWLLIAHGAALGLVGGMVHLALFA